MARPRAYSSVRLERFPDKEEVPGSSPGRPTSSPSFTVLIVQVRVERVEDEHAVRALHVAAFGAEGETIADLVADLRTTMTAQDGLSLVADEAGRVVGNVMFTTSLLDTPRRLVDVQVLSPLAVLPEWQGRGIGAALVRRGLELMAGRSVPVVFLEGAPEYYGRFGFTAGADQGFRKPSLRIPDAAFQAIRLPAYEPWMTGTLVYSEVFWRHDAVGLREQTEE
jgi:putative acetyltransferase